MPPGNLAFEAAILLTPSHQKAICIPAAIYTEDLHLPRQQRQLRNQFFRGGISSDNSYNR